MKRKTAILALLLLTPGVVLAQSLKEQLPGAWRLVSIYNEDKGVKTNTYGDKPLGLAMYDRSGNIIQFIGRADVPKFAVANRQKGTDKEYRDAMRGTISGFGTYTVQGDTVTIKWVASSFPNRTGTTETRTYKLVGDELHITNPTASSGGTAFTRYVRAK